MNTIIIGYATVVLAASLTSSLCAGVPLHEKTDAVEQVEFGKNAVLRCESNSDNEHLFAFWELAKRGDGVVGPGNQYDRSKYNYEILSGNLTIRAVSLDQAGVYKCVSHGVKKSDNYNIRSVRMVVEKDWEDVWEHDSSINYLRVTVIICSFIVLSALGYFIYTMIKRRDYHRAMFMDSEDDDDDSAEVFRAPGTSKSTGNIILDNAGFEGTSMPTDFKKVFNNSRNDEI